MPGKVAKIGTFSDWVGLFDEWRKEIGVNRDEIASFKFDTLYGAIETEEIQFGHFKCKRKKCSSAELLKISACSAHSTLTWTTGWTFSPTPTSSTVTENSSCRC